MKLTTKQAAENRRRIIEASVAPFKSKGTDRVSLHEIANAAGFTHGGFYNHFDSKDALIAEAYALAFSTAAATVENAAKTSQTFTRSLHESLSVDERDDPSRGSPTSTLVGDAARQCRAARAAFAEGIERFLRAFESRLEEADVPAREAALNTLSSIVGAMVLARGIGDAHDELSRSFLVARRKQLAREDRERGRALRHLPAASARSSRSALKSKRREP